MYKSLQRQVANWITWVYILGGPRTMGLPLYKDALNTYSVWGAKFLSPPTVKCVV